MADENANYLVKGSDLIAIAESIRSKKGILTEMEIPDMPDIIDSIDGNSSGLYAELLISGDSITGVDDIDLSLPDEISDIANDAFKSISVIKTISNSDSILTIGNNSFYDCDGLTSVEFLNAITLGSGAFQTCSNLETASFPNVTTIGSSAFNSCSTLANLYFPKLTSIPSQAFYNNSSLTNINFPLVTSITGSMVFRGCSNLESANFASLTTIEANAFLYDSKLDTLVLGANEVCTLNNTNAFSGTPFASNGTGGTLYVPRALIEDYKIANNWLTILSYANNQILAIEDM